MWRVWNGFSKVYPKQIKHKSSRHFILDPSTRTHTWENLPRYLSSLQIVKIFWNVKGLKWFPQSLPKTNQTQKLKAFHPRPFHLHPHLGRPRYSSSLQIVKTFWNVKGLKWFLQSLSKTNQTQKLKAFHPRPFHPHPHLGKLATLCKQSSDSKDLLKCEGFKMASPKSTQNKSRTQTRHGDLHKRVQMPNRSEKEKDKKVRPLKIWKSIKDVVRRHEISLGYVRTRC